MILICPDWCNRWYWQAAQEHVVRSFYFAPGTHVFELPSVSVGGIRWGLWAYLLDGELSKQDYLTINKTYTSQEVDGTWKNTSSAKRRRRRKAQQTSGQ